MMCSHPSGVECTISHEISGDSSRTTSPSAMMSSGVISSAYGGTKSMPSVGAMCIPSGTYWLPGFSSGSSVFPSSEPSTSTTVRKAESSTVFVGPSIWERSTTRIT